MQELANSYTRSEREKGPMNTGPRFARESHEAHYKAVLYLMEVGAALNIDYSISIDGDHITITTSNWT